MPREPSKEDLADLKVGRELGELILHPGWKHYERLLSTKLKEQETYALTPLHLRLDLERLDGVSKVLLGEAAKGAIIGLRLALDIPHGIIRQMNELRATLIPSSPAKDDE